VFGAEYVGEVGHQGGYMRTGAIFGILFSALVSTYTGQAEAEPEITLYCTGSARSPIANQEEIQTDAIVRFPNKAIYLEINAVGSGHSASPPKAVDSMQVVGSITLSSAFQGRPDIKASYNLNRYSGSLTVFPIDKNEKVLFNGVCKRATSLF